MSTPSGEARRWFYVRDGRRHGPVQTSRLVDLVLGGEVSEDALIWHSGLPEWLPARDVEEIRRELPPPVPKPPPPSPPVLVEVGERAEEGDATAGEGTAGLALTTGPSQPETPANDRKRRRKRKRRHGDVNGRPAWLWPLVVILVGLMIFLWWLLRRMNDVPPGRIIQSGSLHETRDRSSRMSTGLSLSRRE
jgi:GYF domain 2